MRSLNLLLLFFILISSVVGCKTQSQIRREQHMENLTRQVSEGQRMTAETTIRLQSMEERINNLHGALEEKGYAEQIQREESLSGMDKRLETLEETQRSLMRQLEETKKQIDAQKSYLDQVLETLKQISDGEVSLKKKPTDQIYQEAVRLYRRAQYGKSRSYFQELLNRDVKGQTLAHTYHNMGMIEYMAGRNDQAIVFFSRLFTEFSDSGYNRNGLLFLAKTFERTGRKQQAAQTLEQLINRFPDANRIDDAKKMLARLK